METTPAIQDYLGAIYDLAGSKKQVIGARLARHMHVSAPSITEALRRMRREGYIRIAGHKEIRLTSKGLYGYGYGYEKRASGRAATRPCAPARARASAAPSAWRTRRWP